MKLKFQNWLDKQKFSRTVDSIFAEAIVCFKADAYRASMVLSYIGFLTIIKERMLVASCPNGIPPTLWANILSDLQKEDIWDTTVKDATQRVSPASIFQISTDLREQIIFWKNRRNDCAHFKNNYVAHYDIESFWAFIEYNIPKICVNGSKSALLNKIQTHFDINLTPRNQSPAQIVEEIDYAISTSDLQTFFADIHQIFVSLGIDMAEHTFNFYNDIFRTNNPDVKTNLAQFIRSNPILVLELLRRYPKHVVTLDLEPSNIRNCWYSSLFNSYENDLPIFCEFLRNNMIPTGEIAEAVNVILNKIQWGAKPLNDEQFLLLEEVGFYDNLRRKILDEGKIDDWNYSNRRAELIANYCEKRTLDLQMVSGISRAFSRDYHPHNLRDSLNALFNTNPSKKQEFHNIAGPGGISIPAYLGGLR